MVNLLVLVVEPHELRALLLRLLLALGHAEHLALGHRQPARLPAPADEFQGEAISARLPGWKGGLRQQLASSSQHFLKSLIKNY